MKFLRFVVFVLWVHAQNADEDRMRELEKILPTLENEIKELEGVLQKKNDTLEGRKKAVESQKRRIEEIYLPRQVNQTLEDCTNDVNEWTGKNGALREELQDVQQDEFVKAEEEKVRNSLIANITRSNNRFLESTQVAQKINNRLKEKQNNNTRERERLQGIIDDLYARLKELEDNNEKAKPTTTTTTSFWTILKNGLLGLLDFKKKIISFFANIQRLKFLKLRAIISFLTGGLIQ